MRPLELPTATIPAPIKITYSMFISLHVDFMEGINDDFKEGNEGINDLISAGREMNYQMNYGREMNKCVCFSL